MNSTRGHRENVLRPSARYVGAGTFGNPQAGASYLLMSSLPSN